MAGVEVAGEGRRAGIEFEAGQKFEAELIGDGLAHRHAEPAAGVADDEVDRLRRDRLRGHHEVALVLAVLVVHEHDHAAGAELRREPHRWSRIRGQSSLLPASANGGLDTAIVGDSASAEKRRRPLARSGLMAREWHALVVLSGLAGLLLHQDLDHVGFQANDSPLELASADILRRSRRTVVGVRFALKPVQLLHKFGIGGHDDELFRERPS